jgi:inner membrane protein
MDSLTHALLGAAAGESVLGRQYGRKAMLYGSIAGLTPDIDVFIGIFMSDIDKLLFHRGITHSFVFILLSAPLLGWLASRLDAITMKQQMDDDRRKARFRQWTFLAFLTQLSHILLDSFTSYGTQIYLPFSSEAIALSTISIIDPLFTLPLLIGVIPLIFSKKGSARLRRWLSFGAILLACLYLGITVVNKLNVERQFMNAYEQAGIEISHIEVKPTLFNNLLWRGIAREASTDLYYVGYASLADGQPGVGELQLIEGGHGRIEGLHDRPELQRLIWVSQGFYKIERQDDEFIFSDLRFGRISEFTGDSKTPYAFSYRIRQTASESGLRVQRIELQVDPERERRSVKLLWQRIFGLSS